MSRILQFPNNVKPLAAVASIDTVEIFFPPWLRTEQLRNLRQIGKLEECWDRSGQFRVGYLLAVNRPSRSMIGTLDDLHRRYRGTMSRFDVALDSQPPDPHQFRNQVASTCVLRWRRKGRMLNYAGTVYWVNFEDRPNPYRNLCLYRDDKPNRWTGQPGCHLELRFLRAKAVKDQGVRRPLDLLNINPKALFDKHAKWSDAGARHVQIMTRKAVRNGQNPKLVIAPMRRFGSDRSQYVKDQFPNRNLHAIASPFSIPSELTWERRPHSHYCGKQTAHPPFSRLSSHFSTFHDSS
jgi:hypothetical protein